MSEVWGLVFFSCRIALVCTVTAWGAPGLGTDRPSSWLCHFSVLSIFASSAAQTLTKSRIFFLKVLKPVQAITESCSSHPKSLPPLRQEWDGSITPRKGHRGWVIGPGGTLGPLLLLCYFLKLKVLLFFTLPTQGSVSKNPIKAQTGCGTSCLEAKQEG